MATLGLVSRVAILNAATGLSVAHRPGHVFHKHVLRLIAYPIFPAHRNEVPVDVSHLIERRGFGGIRAMTNAPGISTDGSAGVRSMTNAPGISPDGSAGKRAVTRCAWNRGSETKKEKRHKSPIP